MLFPLNYGGIGYASHHRHDNPFLLADLVQPYNPNYFSISYTGHGVITLLQTMDDDDDDALLHKNDSLYYSASSLSVRLTKRPLMRGRLSANFLRQSYLMRLRQIRRARFS